MKYTKEQQQKIKEMLNNIANTFNRCLSHDSVLRHQAYIIEKDDNDISITFKSEFYDTHRQHKTTLKCNFKDDTYDVYWYSDVDPHTTKENADEGQMSEHSLSTLYPRIHHHTYFCEPLNNTAYFGDFWKYVKSLDGVSDSKEILEDFMYRIDDSQKLSIKSDFDSIEEFFEASTNTPVYLNIIAVDTKETIAKLEKSNKGCKFIVDLTNEDGENFSIKSFIKPKDDFIKMISSTAESLRNFEQFAKYADDLEEAIN